MTNDSELTRDDMVPIPIEEFVSGTIIPVNLYIRLADDHFVLLAKAGTATQVDQLSSYQTKQVRHLWVKKEHFSKYVKQNITIAGMILEKKQVSGAKKSQFLRKAAAAVNSEIMDLGLNPETLSHAQMVTSSTVTLIEAQPDLSELLDSLNSSSGLVDHASAASLLCVMIGKANGWQNRSILEKLALGGLLHDIGKKELPEDIVFKPRAKMTFEEVEMYESHPYRGMQILESLGVIPDDVLAMVHEHHENAAGQGFPRKLRDMRINPLARVCILANVFVELTLPHPHSGQAKSALDAIRYMENVMGTPFNKQIYRSFKQLVSDWYNKRKRRTA